MSRNEDSRPALLAPERWPSPKWGNTTVPTKGKRYEDYVIDQLRARYLELEGDFLTAYGNFHDSRDADQVTAERTADLLQRARQRLESRHPDLVTVSTELDLAERYMVWIYPVETAALEAPSYYAKVEALPEGLRASFKAQLAHIFDGSGALRRDKADDLRSVYDEIIGAYNAHLLQNRIHAGLQLKRLNRFLRWGVALVAVVVLTAPVVTPAVTKVQVHWPYHLSLLPARFTNTWLSAIAVALLGSLGGFLSGLLQARGSRVTLAEYQENSLQLGLRPVVGALVSLVVYVLVSWEAIPGVTVSTFGAMLLIALTAGFSERFFLRLIKLDVGDAPGQEVRV